MSGQDQHPHVTHDPHFQTPHQYRQQPVNDDDAPISIDIDISPSRPITLLDIDQRNGLRLPAMENVTPEQLAAMTADQKILHLQQIATKQHQQLQEANAFAARQAAFLEQQQRQLEQSQNAVERLTTAFSNMSTQMASNSRPAPKKKPDLPPFDRKNINIWIRRLLAAYDRVGVTEPRDKFAWLESIFQVGLDPKIDAFLYGTNSDQDWEDFLVYLKKEYGPSKRQQTVKLLSDIPRQDLKPSQYLLQLKEDTKDVEIDDIRKEHLLKSIPPRIREIMGKQVDDMTADEVAVIADDYFDKQGRPLEKSVNPVNNIDNSAPSFTPAFSDEEETDVNFIKRNQGRGNSRHRSRSRPRFSGQQQRSSSSSSSSSTPGGKNNAASGQQNDNVCYFHRKFKEKSTRCMPTCPKYAAFKNQQKQQGNGQGARRM